MAYELEDEFGDIIGKARRGNGLSLSQVASGARYNRSSTLSDGSLYAQADGRSGAQDRKSVGS